MDGEIPLARIADVLGGYAFKSENFSATGFPIVKIANIEPPAVSLADCDKIPANMVYGLDRFTLRDGDIVMAMTGATIGKVGRLRSAETAYLNQRVAKISAKAGREYDDFVWAVVSQRGFEEDVLNNAGGSAQANVSADGIGRIPIPDFTPGEQRAIGGVIAALDDKIELNRRMNRTLEELTGALFRSWFVEFEPVSAKAAGRAPNGFAAIFPATFSDSELGPIPHGWRVQPIGDVIRAVGGSTPSTTEPRYWSGGEHAWATPRDLANLSDPVLLATERQITSAGLERITSGLLPVGTVLLSSRAPIGYTAITEIPVAVNQGFIALDCNKSLPNYYVIEWVRENMEVIEGRANGTTFMEISKANFRPIPAIVPAPDVVAQFSAIVAPWWRQIVHNVRETHTLAALRDTLLPRLLSGELRVKDAEKLAEAKV